MTIFNDKKLPKVKTILEATAEVMNSVAEDKAKIAYDTQMKKVGHRMKRSNQS